MTHFDFTEYRSILCLNGTLPRRDFFDKVRLPVIAADGAANSLNQLGITAKIIIGDLDSVSDVLKQQNKILYVPDQSTSDYQKSHLYLHEHNLLPSIVVGINGGHLDHILNNINIFLETDSVLYAPPLIGMVQKRDTARVFNLPQNTKISLIGMPFAQVSSNGLKWELNKQELRFPGKSSCFNRTQNTSVNLEVHEGSLLVLIYDEPAIDAGI